jgi:hypothetical protein
MFSSLKEDEVTKAITARNFIPALKTEALGITGMNLRWNFVFPPLAGWLSICLIPK